MIARGVGDDYGGLELCLVEAVYLSGNFGKASCTESLCRAGNSDGYSAGGCGAASGARTSTHMAKKCQVNMRAVPGFAFGEQTHFSALP